MATFINDYLVQLDKQWEEIDLLIGKAEENVNDNIPLYDALCRSVSVLMVAHLEGFIKDVTKNLIRDLAQNLKFKELPEAIKRTYCKKYLGFDSSAIIKYEVILNEMVDDFSRSEDLKITYDPFLFDNNRNPKPESLKLVCNRLGVNDIFRNLHCSIFDNVFESDRALTRQLVRFENIVKRSTSEFPYKASIEKFKLSPKKCNGGRTLWQEFLDDLNQMRHKIAHGNTFGNSDSLAHLKRRKSQVKLLKLVVTYCLCAKSFTVEPCDE